MEPTIHGVEQWWPSSLPGPAQRLLVCKLPVYDRRNLRLACKAALVMVDACTERLRVSKADLIKGKAHMQQRFPVVTQLVVSCRAVWHLAERHLAGNAAVWPNVNTLTMQDASLRCAQQLLPSFPHAQQLFLDGHDLWTRGLHLGPLIAQLPRIESLKLHKECCLGGEQLLMLAKHVPYLTALKVSVAGASHAHLSALTSLSALQELCMHDWGMQGPATTVLGVLDLSSMTQLIKLQWGGGHWLLGFGAGPAAPELRLPTSIVQLELNHMPDMAMPALPHLTSLQLTSRTTCEQQFLAHVATNCTALLSLSLDNLVLTAACHSAPLAALTELIVATSASEQEGTQYVRVFPQLRRLDMRCSMFEPQPSPGRFAGLSTLTRLEICARAYKESASFHPGVMPDEPALSLADFQALALLPALSAVTLFLHPLHLQHVGLLSQLAHFSWVWSMGMAFWDKDALIGLTAAFNGSMPPANLAYASCLFDDCIIDIDSDLDTTREWDMLVDAAIAWLAHASGLRDVTWSTDAMFPVFLTASRVIRMAAIPSVKHLRITWSPGTIVLEPELQHALQAIIKHHGMEVTVML